MAAMILSAQGKLPYTHFVFANVGDDSENPDTLSYIKDHAQPYADAHGLTIVEVKRQVRGVDAPTLLEDAMQDNGNISIPVYMANGAPGSRNCTSKWKIAVIEKWVRQYTGATKENRVPIGVGISIDEFHRMRTDDPEREPYTYKEYPLIDLRLSRVACQRIITEANMKLAPKSSCWFCPYKRRSEWAHLRATKPALFDKAVALEQRLNEKRERYGKDAVHLTSYGNTLDSVIPLQSMQLFSDEDDFGACESGYCMT